MEFKAWEERTFQEKATGWPAWHPYPIKCLLTVVLEYGISFSAVEVVARAMGLLKVSMSQDVGFPIGNGQALPASLMTFAWVDVNEVEEQNDEE